MNPVLPALQADSLPTELPGNPLLTRLLGVREWPGMAGRPWRLSQEFQFAQGQWLPEMFCCGPARKGVPQQPTIQPEG